MDIEKSEPIAATPQKIIFNKEKLLTAIPLILFAVLSFAGIRYHELWLDEAHHWLLARDSHSLIELWTNTRYEGHPIVWNLILYVITLFTNDPLWMQIVHWLLAVTAAALLMCYSPFPRYFNILFIFGYFTFYEYAIISRNYSILLIAFILCLKNYSVRRYVPLGVSLLFLANTHLFGLILSLFFIIIIYSKNEFTWSRGVSLGALIFIAGIIASILQIRPPSDSPFNPDLHAVFSTISINRFLAIFVRAFTPVPDFFNYHFWNSNLITAISKGLAAVTSVAIILVALRILIQRPKIALFFFGFTFSIALVIASLYPASVVQATRHFGVVYIVFIGCLWLMKDDPERKSRFRFNTRIQRILITALLCIQVLAGICCWYYDVKRPFTEARNVITYLKQNKLASLPVLTFHGPIPTISCYLERPTYSLPDGTLESFYVWNKDLKKPIDQTTIQAAIDFAQEKNTDCVLVTYTLIPAQEHIQSLMGFAHAAVGNTLFVYKVTMADNVRSYRSSDNK